MKKVIQSISRIDTTEFDNKIFKETGSQTKKKLESKGIESPQPTNGTFWSKSAKALVFFPKNIKESEKEAFQIKYEEEYLKCWKRSIINL